MALSRRTGSRFQGSIWPGFVDAMTGLLLVLMFVLTIFMVVQFVLTERITGQETELDTLSGEVAALARALGLQEQTNTRLETELGELSSTLGAAQDQVSQQDALIATLTAQRDSQIAALQAAVTEITQFEAQVAGLLAQRDSALGERDAARNEIADLETRQSELISAQEALNLALATARTEIDSQAEEARLAASRREALDAMVADLTARNAESAAKVADLQGQVDETTQALSDEEAARLAEATAAKALREQLAQADTELTAMTLALEAQRKEAEDTLTLLAAAEAVEGDLDARLNEALIRLQSATASQNEAESEVSAMQEELALLRAEKAAREAALASESENTQTLRDQLAAAVAARLAAETQAAELGTNAQRAAEVQAALLAAANNALEQEEATSTEAQRQTALLNQQVAELRAQLGGLQTLLDDANARDAETAVELQSLGSDLNTALARVAAEERRRAELEAAERARLEAEAAELAAQTEDLQAQTEDLEAQTKDLEQYRSEFFGRLRDVLGAQEGVRIEGDRFVFSSEVLFPPGGADLSFEGQGEIAKVASILRSVADDIPPEIDWVIRVDGHTDDVPLGGRGKYSDNWELSQGRALSVVKYMINFLGIPPDRLAANGFGQYQPVALEDSPEARAQNRRIELKFTEK